MQLLGGVWRKQRLNRDFSFKPVNGWMEMAVARQAQGRDSIPRRVSCTLVQTLERLGGQPPSMESVANLAVGDRQYLMRQLGSILGREQDWMKASCVECGADFDFLINHGQLPVKPAAPDFPFVEIATSLGHLRFRVPTGLDQEELSGSDPDTDLTQALIRSCCLSTEQQGKADPAPLDFNTQDVEKIELELERVAPEVGNRIVTECPECGASNRVEVDPYYCLNGHGGDIFHQVHVLASTYHWSEDAILAMDRVRRHKYLGLIDAARGLSH